MKLNILKGLSGIFKEHPSPQPKLELTVELIVRKIVGEDAFLTIDAGYDHVTQCARVVSSCISLESLKAYFDQLGVKTPYAKVGTSCVVNFYNNGVERLVSFDKG